jgi:predicted GNAT family N-acyltransferase
VSRQKISEAGVSVIDANWLQDYTAISDIRHAVFVQEQGIPEHLEWDGQDADSSHVLALLDDRRAVATGRLQPDGRLGRMAVLGQWRGQGIGRAILERLLQQARRQRLAAVYLHAQTEAAGFYSKAGFSRRGESFPEAGIQHVIMVRELD